MCDIRVTGIWYSQTHNYHTCGVSKKYIGLFQLDLMRIHPHRIALITSGGTVFKLLINVQGTNILCSEGHFINLISGRMSVLMKNSAIYYSKHV